ncbi:PTS sugar transporter subunit IIC [Alkalicella caledoniensis]|uniref:Permease IIC component n=1 Tax=Alkalicella caledoniensis TaxID=2731377 RepID=A0A7G9W5U5_ALKCA|nr:PTS transporter subunit EIIC [Alkalicella caledoniensis]QNO14057.1 PTS sugar transporter subunit IIC [Alkalicella caledoniensis]
MEENRFLDKFSMVAAKFGNQVHLRSLRDGFAILMPMFILAGIAVLINSVVFPWFWEGDTLWTAQYWGRMVTNGTLNISSILLAPMVAYFLSKNKGFKNPIASAALAISVLAVMMPFTTSLTPIGASDAVEVIGIMRFADLGTQGMFAGIIIGLLSTELFIKLSSFKKFEINLGDDVPPAVGQSFNVLIPVMLVVSIFAAFSLFLLVAFETNLLALVAKFVQEPLRAVNTSIWGAVLIYSVGNFLFTLGIHQTIINGVLLMPIALVNMNENMLAFQNGIEIPNIITSVFIPTFGMIGGTGSTISLIIATIIFSKQRSSKSVAKLGTAPGIFNINEPIIFGYPIVFNLPMMIPFVLLPSLGIIFAYFATALGFMNHTVVLIPWTTPPLLSGFLATGGDWRAVVVQLIIIVGGVFLYLPFMKISERTAQKMMTMDNGTNESMAVTQI